MHRRPGATTREAPRRSAAPRSVSLPALGHDRFVGRREQPRLGGTAPAERAQGHAVEGELRHAGRAGPDLDRILPGEGECLAVAEHLTCGTCLRVELAI